MPRNLDQYTQCAAPGIAHEFSVPGVLLTFIAAGGIGALVLSQIAGLPCEVASTVIGGIVIGLIAALDQFEYWFYNERLMCIDEPRCVIGTVAGEPHDACDGDRKIDILIAPFRFLEVEITLAWEAATTLNGADPLFPAPPALVDYVANRDLRLEYVNGMIPVGGPLLTSASRLNNDQRKRLYLEIVHQRMFVPPAMGQPDRRFQQHMYIRDQAQMGTPAFTNSPDDRFAAPDPNPMYRWEREEVSGAGFFGDFFCDFLLGQPSDDAPEDRLVPYLHNEIEGNRLARGLNNFKLTLFSFGGAFIAACAICRAIPAVGQIPFLCEGLALLVAALFAWLVWLLSKLFNDPDDGEAGEISVDVPSGPEVTGDPLTDDVGDLVLVFGRWIMDVEHERYFEIHPVQAWYRIARSPDGDPRLVDDVSDLHGGEALLTASDIDQNALEEMCKHAQTAEKGHPDDPIEGSTGKLLSVARGLE